MVQESARSVKADCHRSALEWKDRGQAKPRLRNHRFVGLAVQGSLEAPVKIYASDVAYLPHGAIQTMKLGNGLWEPAAYNSRLQPVDLKLGTSDGGHELWRLENNYGATSNNGNVLGQTITMPKSAGGMLTLTQTYTASNNRCLGLGYENAGNVVSYATRSLDYDAENRQTSLTDGGTTFHYTYL